MQVVEINAVRPTPEQMQTFLALPDGPVLMVHLLPFQPDLNYQLRDTEIQLGCCEWFEKEIVTTDPGALFFDGVTEPRCDYYDRNGPGLRDLADQTDSLKTIRAIHH